MSGGKPLPPGWRLRVCSIGAYFAHEKSQVTTFYDPRTGISTVTGDKEMPHLRHLKNFSWKLYEFQCMCYQNCAVGKLELKLGRQSVFDDSFDQLMKKERSELRKGLKVFFEDEEARDYGGLSREWFLLLSRDLLNPLYCLFEYANTQTYLLRISPLSYMNPLHLRCFKFVGRVVGLALFNYKFIDCSFTMPFYKRDSNRILKRPLTLHDLESVDPEFYNSVLFISEMDLDELEDMHLHFVHSFSEFGQVHEVELKDGGAGLLVTEINKDEYIQLLVEARVNRGVTAQAAAFLTGFEEVISLGWLKYFDERELEVMLCGVQEIDLEDWRENTEYRTYEPTDKQIIWFWDFVYEMNNDERIRLLQFVTGTCRIPLGGFKDLMGNTFPHKFCIERMGDNQNSLPKSHTCFNRLDLPAYESYELLKMKLLFAVEETEGFGME
ncbi:NEDD4-like E3 ubiquitin-protein ligase WWP1 [Symsagittifera roscoffensis]|uniref:NEDD4-like E3 ubiquitin-protein ligase WWP1 n=1 Tax=Symsagittifera roscoffensis TaxID=84072 RepID=UPI00307C05CC